MQKTSTYQNQNLKTSISIFLLSALMIGFSVYLTSHYFDLKFPTGLEGKALCNLNQFFNCDKTSLSLFGNIFGVPTGLFGAIVGLLVMAGLVIRNDDYERSIYFILTANLIGCAFLLFYSLFILKGLCPLCTLYYITSGALFLIFFKKSQNIIPSLKYLAIFATIVLLFSGLAKMNINSKEKVQSAVAEDLIKQYYSLPNLGVPKIVSEFKIATAPNAPLKMIIFSDFECPACKGLSELMPQLTSRYYGKIDIQYFYYPLDNSCNSAMERPLHHYACKAAYTASCMPLQEFSRVHEEIFQNQDKFESGYLDTYIKKNHLEKCVADAATKEKVVALVKAADPFNIRSTPTFLLNGVKIEGALPLDQMCAIMDEILKRAK